MIYGIPDKFINDIRKIENKAVMNEEKELEKQKGLVKKEFNKMLVKKKNSLIYTMNTELENHQNKVLFAHKVKVLELRESIKNDLVNKFVNKTVKKLSKAKNNKSSLYSKFINRLIIESIDSLGGKSFNVRLARNDSWVKRKLKGINHYKIKFIKPGDFETGVIVYKHNMKELVDNTIEKRVNNLKQDLYELIDGVLIWEK